MGPAAPSRALPSRKCASGQWPRTPAAVDTPRPRPQGTRRCTRGGCTPCSSARGSCTRTSDARRAPGRTCTCRWAAAGPALRERPRVKHSMRTSSCRAGQLEMSVWPGLPPGGLPAGAAVLADVEELHLLPVDEGQPLVVDLAGQTLLEAPQALAEPRARPPGRNRRHGSLPPLLDGRLHSGGLGLRRHCGSLRHGQGEGDGGLGGRDLDLGAALGRRPAGSRTGAAGWNPRGWTAWSPEAAPGVELAAWWPPSVSPGGRLGPSTSGCAAGGWRGSSRSPGLAPGWRRYPGPG